MFSFGQVVLLLLFAIPFLLLSFRQVVLLFWQSSEAVVAGFAPQVVLLFLFAIP